MKPRIFLLIATPLLLAGCSLAPKTVLPAPPVPQSWPVGDAYLLQSEAALHKSMAWCHLTCASSPPRQVDPAVKLGYLVCRAPPCNYKRALPRVAA